MPARSLGHLHDLPLKVTMMNIPHLNPSPSLAALGLPLQPKLQHNFKQLPLLAGELNPAPSALSGDSPPTSAPVVLAWPVVYPRHGVPFARTSAAQRPPVAVTAEVQQMLEEAAVVAVGVSGGKDSDAVAVAVAKHLDRIGHQGPRVLIHSDLGRVEWKQSLPHCQKLASRLGWELMVVRRAAGDLMHRWEARWQANLERYKSLSCVTLILPWSTPQFRFCTGELKTQLIARELRKRWPKLPVLNVTGIRRQESSARSRMPVSAEMTLLKRKHAEGRSWNPIIEWQVEDVFGEIADAGLDLHEAYTTYGASRVSCSFCIMSTARDLLAGASNADNVEVLREMVSLEIESTFGFQGSRWLADVAPELLTSAQRAAAPLAQVAARQRVLAEREIPKSLMLVNGKPTAIPSLAEATALADVRLRVAKAVGFYGGLLHTTPQAVRDRYAELLDGSGSWESQGSQELSGQQEGSGAVDLCGMH